MCRWNCSSPSVVERRGVPASCANAGWAGVEGAADTAAGDVGTTGAGAMVLREGTSRAAGAGGGGVAVGSGAGAGGDLR
jgi:hypothetical protein